MNPTFTVNTNTVTTFEVVFRATAEQIGIIQHPARVKVVVAGRRWGKSTLIALYLAKVAIENPGCKVWYVSNVYAQSLDIMRMMKRNAAFMQFVKNVNLQSPPRFELKNGATIAFRTCDDPDSLRGAGLLFVALDEAAFSDSVVYEQILGPMLLDSGGTILLASTYNGRNYYYDLSQVGLGEHERIKTWVYPTSTGLRFRSEKGRKDLEEMLSTYAPAVRDQEFNCVPLSVANAVFRGVDNVIKGMPGTYNQNNTYIMGLDIGRVKDPSAVVVLECETGQVVFVQEFPLGEPHAMQAQRAKAIAEEYRAEVCADTTVSGKIQGQPESYIMFYREAIRGLREIVWTNPKKVDMVNHLALEIERERIFIPPTFAELIAQIKLYRYKLTKNYHLPTYGPPSEKDHDDQLAALIMASWGRKMHWNRKIEATPLAPPPGTVGRMFYDQRHKSEQAKGTL